MVNFSDVPRVESIITTRIILSRSIASCISKIRIIWVLGTLGRQYLVRSLSYVRFPRKCVSPKEQPSKHGGSQHQSTLGSKKVKKVRCEAESINRIKSIPTISNPKKQSYFSENTLLHQSHKFLYLKFISAIHNY